MIIIIYNNINICIYINNYNKIFQIIIKYMRIFVLFIIIINEDYEY